MSNAVAAKRQTRITIAGDEWRLTRMRSGWDGSPYVLVSRQGPNNSPAGHGPKKAFPWGSEFDGRIPLPRLTFRHAYRLRRIGGLKVYAVSERLVRRVCGAV